MNCESAVVPLIRANCLEKWERFQRRLAILEGGGNPDGITLERRAEVDNAAVRRDSAQPQERFSAILWMQYEGALSQAICSCLHQAALRTDIPHRRPSGRTRHLGEVHRVCAESS